MQMLPLLPMTYRFAYPLSCGGGWEKVRYRGFFSGDREQWCPK